MKQREIVDGCVIWWYTTSPTSPRNTRWAVRCLACQTNTSGLASDGDAHGWIGGHTCTAPSAHNTIVTWGENDG